MSQTPQSSASSSPPTMPRAAKTQPFERLAGVSLGLGIAGLLLLPLAIAAIVTGAMAWRRVLYSGRQPTGLPHSIIGFSLGILGILTSTVTIVVAIATYSIARQIPHLDDFGRLVTIHQGAQVWAGANNNQYPDHVARFTVDQLTSTRYDVAFAINGHTTPPPPLLVGDFDLAQATAGTADVDELEAALATQDLSTPTYSIGDVTFVRLPEPTSDGQILFMWHVDIATGTVLMVTDNGMPQFVTNPDRWAVLWKLDASARNRHGLPPLPAPTYPLR